MSDPGDRTRYWPAIERRYGQPIAHWLDLIGEHATARYPEQIALLRGTHGFSQAHANAVVMFARGSTTSARHTTLDGYLKDKDPAGAATARAILDGLVDRYPGSRIALAWNQPFLTREDQRLFSVGVMQHHLLAAPWSAAVLERFRPALHERGLTVNRKTFRLPFGWDIDEHLLDAMVAQELSGTA